MTNGHFINKNIPTTLLHFQFSNTIPIFNLSSSSSSSSLSSLSLPLFMATRIPFTESQWEELENQALVFKYLASNVPVPPHLLFLIKRPFLFSSSSSSSSSSFFSPTLSPHCKQTLSSFLLSSMMVIFRVW